MARLKKEEEKKKRQQKSSNLKIASTKFVKDWAKEKAALIKAGKGDLAKDKEMTYKALKLLR